MEEVKNDLYTLEKQLTSLMQTYVHVTTQGLSKYSQPTDFGIGYSMTLLDGSSTGTFQTGSTTTSWILDADETATSAGLVGKEILVYAGTAIRQLAQVTAYNTSTLTATVSGCTTAPVLNDSYVIIDTYTTLEPPVQVWEYDAMGNQKSQGTPNEYAPIGDADDGEFMIHPTPYRSSAIPWGIKQRYFADLMRLDLAGTTIVACYRRWRNLFIQGVKAKCLEFLNDERAQTEMQVYFSLLQVIARSDKYNTEIAADMQVSPEVR